MKVTYLGHSGFAVLTASAAYLFDYIRGDLPDIPDGIPLYVFASHFHGDHFSELIFEEAVRSRCAGYVLGGDILREGLGEKVRQKAGNVPVFWAEAGEELQLKKPDAIRVRFLESTDSGVAFLVLDAEGTIYHAGDLNWWHWDGEPEEENRGMGEWYCREIDRLRGVPVHTAFVPLDPRLDYAYGWGLHYFLKTVSCKNVYPMHFWGDYSVIPRFVKEYGYADQIQNITQEGQTFVR